MSHNRLAVSYDYDYDKNINNAGKCGAYSITDAMVAGDVSFLFPFLFILPCDNQEELDPVMWEREVRS